MYKQMGPQHNTYHRPPQEAKRNGAAPAKVDTRQTSHTAMRPQAKPQAQRPLRRRPQITQTPAPRLPATGSALVPAKACLPKPPTVLGAGKAPAAVLCRVGNGTQWHSPPQVHNAQPRGFQQAASKTKGSHRWPAVVAMARVLLHWKMSSVPVSANQSHYGCQPASSNTKQATPTCLRLAAVVHQGDALGATRKKKQRIARTGALKEMQWVRPIDATCK